MIKTKKIILALLIVLTASATANAADGGKLSQIVQLAEKNNPSIFAQEQKVRRAQAALNESNAKMLPKLKAIYAGIWTENPLLDISAIQLPIKMPFSDKNVFVSAVALQQTIYSGGSLPALKAAAKFALNATEAESTRTIQTVDNGVHRAYFGYKRAEAKQEVAHTGVKLAKDHAVQAEKLFAQGVISKADVLRAKVAVADAELKLIQAQNAKEIAYVALERAVGTKIPEELLEGEETINFALKTEGNVEDAYQNRADIKMYDLYSKQAAKIARAGQGELLPHILGFAGYAKLGTDSWPKDGIGWNAGLAATWSLFDSGEAHARTEQARSRSREFLYRLEDKKNEIKMEVREAELNLKAARSKQEVAKRQLAQSEEDYRIAVVRYKENIGTNLDMLDARLALINSKSSVVDAKYDILTAEANLLFAVGK